MGSVRFDGVVFFAYTRDHPPPHVHAVYGALIVIVDLLPGGGVAVAERHDAYSPRKPKMNEVRRVMRCAALHEEALRELWRRTRELSDNR
jgi:hypothetical protein